MYLRILQFSGFRFHLSWNILVNEIECLRVEVGDTLFHLFSLQEVKVLYIDRMQFKIRSIG